MAIFTHCCTCTCFWATQTGDHIEQHHTMIYTRFQSDRKETGRLVGENVRQGGGAHLVQFLYAPLCTFEYIHSVQHTPRRVGIKFGVIWMGVA